MKQAEEFLNYQVVNDATDTIEYETSIGGENCSVYYFKERDEVLIVFWCDWYGDEIKFVKTSNFNSFREYADSNEILIYFTDNWDYANEEVYQEYYEQDFDEWLFDEGTDELKTFVEWQIKEHGIEYIKRPLFNRIKRWFDKRYFNLKKLLR